MISIEQQARDLLTRLGVDDAQRFSSGDLVELANLIAARPRRVPMPATPDVDRLARVLQGFVGQRVVGHRFDVRPHEHRGSCRVETPTLALTLAWDDDILTTAQVEKR